MYHREHRQIVLVQQIPLGNRNCALKGLLFSYRLKMTLCDANGESSSAATSTSGSTLAELGSQMLCSLRFTRQAALTISGLDVDVDVVELFQGIGPYLSCETLRFARCRIVLLNVPPQCTCLIVEAGTCPL